MAAPLVPPEDCDSCAGKQRRLAMCEDCHRRFAAEMTAEVMDPTERYFPDDPT